jgi:NAD(P)-dependent dehydrogenase (short-subunit alcohol dehydrogenase family)
MKVLAGRSALVTGANQGLGLAIARACVEAGAGVIMCARDAARLERARAEVAASPRKGSASSRTPPTSPSATRWTG